MKKLRLLASGGLGDAVMSYAKIESSNAPFYRKFSYLDIELVHQVCRGTDEILKDQIYQFYQSQGLDCKIVIVDSWYQVLDHGSFDYVLEGGWSGKGYNNEHNCWEIEPFPLIEYTLQDDAKKIALIISSGRNQNRGFSFEDCKQFAENHDVLLLGISQDKRFEDLGRNSLVNHTDFLRFINLIASSSIIVGHSGFCCYFAGMLNKEVYCVSEGIPTQGNIHPKWNVKYIDNLEGLYGSKL